jgi:hypothetical protein
MDSIDKISFPDASSVRTKETKHRESSILMLPPNFKQIKNNEKIPGEVIKQDGKIITVKTSQGEIVLQTNQGLIVGTKLLLEPNLINGELKVYIDIPTKDVNDKLNNKILFVAQYDLLSAYAMGSNKANKADQAYDISINRNEVILNAILIAPKELNAAVISNPMFIATLQNLLSKPITNLNDAFKKGDKITLKVLKFIETDATDEEIYISDEGKIVLKGLVAIHDKYQESILKTAIGDFSFYNSELNVGDSVEILLELIEQVNEQKQPMLKLGEIGDILIKLENLENQPINSLPVQFSNNLLNSLLDSKEDIYFILALNQILLANLGSESKTSNASQSLLQSILQATKTLYRQSLTMPWQMLFSPIACEDTLQFVKLFVKKLPGKDSSYRQYRFVIELTIPSLKEVIIDGFIIKQNGQSNFSLNIKTREVLEKDIELGIKHIFQEATKVTKLTGNIAFSALKDYTSPLAENLRDMCIKKAEGIFA